MRVSCAARKDIDVMLLSVLLCAHYWLQVPPRGQTSCLVKWLVCVDMLERTGLYVFFLDTLGHNLRIWYAYDSRCLYKICVTCSMLASPLLASRYRDFAWQSLFSVQDQYGCMLLNSFSLFRRGYFTYFPCLLHFALFFGGYRVQTFEFSDMSTNTEMSLSWLSRCSCRINDF
jgi:hypothetical protein